MNGRMTAPSGDLQILQLGQTQAWLRLSPEAAGDASGVAAP